MPLPPNLPGLDARVARVESLPPGAEVALAEGGALVRWFEEVEGTAEVVERTEGGAPALLKAGGLSYLCGWPDARALRRLAWQAAEEAGLSPCEMPEGLRRKHAHDATIYLNYSPEPVEWEGNSIPPAGVLRVPRASQG